MRNSVLARGVFGILIGLPLSLLIGTAASYLPASPLEGFHAGLIVSSTLFVAVVVLLACTRGARPLKTWLFEVHSFVGLAIAIPLFAIAFSGALLLFRADIETSSYDRLTVPPGGQFASVDDWLAAVATKVDLHRTNQIDIAWPASATAPAEIRASGPEGFRKFYVDPYRATLIEGRLSSGMDWIRTLHTSLHMKRVGGLLAGLTALGSVWLVLGGLFIRSDLFRGWRVLRLNLGSRIFISDLHKRIATWLFPFIFLIAYSGMLLSFAGEFEAGPLRVRFNGSLSEMIAAKGYPRRPPRTERVTTPSLDSFTRVVRIKRPDTSISRVKVLNFGDRDAIVSVYATRPNSFGLRELTLAMNFRGQPTNVISTRSIDDMGRFERFHSVMLGIHVANFGPRSIRILYAAASVLLILLPILGIGMWALRRGNNRERNNAR